MEDKTNKYHVARKCIIIASEERSGSEWLCQIMGSTGVLGKPTEYFNADWQRVHFPDYPEDVIEQANLARRIGTTRNGICAIKMHCAQFDRIKSVLSLSRIFFPALFVRLHRRDKLRQAISLVRARQTMRFHHFSSPKGTEQYDPVLISNTLDELIQTHARWTRYLQTNDVELVDVEYEELHADPIRILARIADAAGVSRDLLATPGRRDSLRIQRDATTEEWRARFLSEASDPDRFP